MNEAALRSIILGSTTRNKPTASLKHKRNVRYAPQADGW